ncbi:MAG TPA: hypothetical protein VI912_04910 [Candidatus Bilamarchaeaceae archaeon]|nr:hypothetical protein [Candidatus Bilamarchaeaceae archaeon]
MIVLQRSTITSAYTLHTSSKGAAARVFKKADSPLADSLVRTINGEVNIPELNRTAARMFDAHMQGAKRGSETRITGLFRTRIQELVSSIVGSNIAMRNTAISVFENEVSNLYRIATDLSLSIKERMDKINDAIANGIQAITGPAVFKAALEHAREHFHVYDILGQVSLEFETAAETARRATVDELSRSISSSVDTSLSKLYDTEKPFGKAIALLVKPEVDAVKIAEAVVDEICYSFPSATTILADHENTGTRLAARFVRPGVEPEALFQQLNQMFDGWTTERVDTETIARVVDEMAAGLKHLDSQSNGNISINNKIWYAYVATEIFRLKLQIRLAAYGTGKPSDQKAAKEFLSAMVSSGSFDVAEFQKRLPVVYAALVGYLTNGKTGQARQSEAMRIYDGKLMEVKSLIRVVDILRKDVETGQTARILDTTIKRERYAVMGGLLVTYHDDLSNVEMRLQRASPS